jgi:Uma2 family endonuclease
VSSTITRSVTADELLAMPDDGYRYELVKGELIQMSPPGDEHGRVTMHVAAPLYQHVKEHGLGVVYAAETGFKLESDPDTVRAPDVAFVSRTRAEQAGKVEGYWIGAPDLAVEVLSPNDQRRRVDEKVAHWLAAGSRMVWVVSPKLRTVTVYLSLTDISVLTEKDTLHGSHVIPGFQIAVADLFQGG